MISAWASSDQQAPGAQRSASTLRAAACVARAGVIALVRASKCLPSAPSILPQANLSIHGPLCPHDSLRLRGRTCVCCACTMVAPRCSLSFTLRPLPTPFLRTARSPRAFRCAFSATGFAGLRLRVSPCACLSRV
eukprot:6194985-Pleurochrysis_carterae.AAC.2